MTPEMLLSMARDPLVFACANPVPEIDPDVAAATRPDVIMATGRSDFPNQINNVCAFPYIFRSVQAALLLAMQPSVQSMIELVHIPLQVLLLSAAYTHNVCSSC